MDFWIVAIDHELQLQRKPSDPPNVSEQKNQLEALLSAEIPKRSVRFIAEESKPGEITIASALARVSNPTIAWINICMTDAEREAAGIREALRDRPNYPDHTMTRSIECRVPEDDIRENFSVDQTLRSAIGFQSVLMLLGDMHVDVVAEKLGKIGHNVSTNHDLCPIKRWE